MRKAISHIFGRNKICTRQIPQHVWVHYCRKHYQRSRYRNPKEYAKMQCGLVQQQIRRIHTWSEGNRAREAIGLPCRSPGVIDGWSLAVRKREQMRIEDLQKKESNKRKRSGASADDEEDGPDNVREPATAVPKWLQEKCGNSYTTQGVLEIFNVLHREIMSDNHISTFPDLEILPNFRNDAKEPQLPRGYSKRSPTSSAHRRSQSMGVVPSRKSPIWAGDEPLHYSHSQKRRRPNTGGPEELEGQEYFRPRFEHPLDSMRHGQNLTRRPMYTHPEEYPEHRDAQPRNGSYPHSPSSLQVPLSAPVPLRTIGSLASQIDNLDLRRPMHHRSQSDCIAFHGPPVYPQSSSGYPRHEAEDGTSSHRMDHLLPNDGYQTPGPFTSMHNQGHGRHQSTPMVYVALSSPGPVYHQTSSIHASPTQRNIFPFSRLAETEKAWELFRDRR
jgi:hypothetical protein